MDSMKMDNKMTVIITMAGLDQGLKKLDTNVRSI